LILFKQSSVKVKAKKGVKHSNSTRVFHQFYVVLPLLLQDFVEVPKTGAKALVSADLRGIDSHGVARLSGYIRLWEAKRVNAAPNIAIIHETPSTAVMDGDQGLGLVVAPAAMEVAIAKALQVGTGWVSVSNSNHFGIAAFHAMKALEKDMIGIVMTNASALVAP